VDYVSRVCAIRLLLTSPKRDGGRVSRLSAAIPQKGTDYERELEPFASMNGRRKDCLAIALNTKLPFFERTVFLDNPGP
jgi:hypothetical protein